MRDSISARKPKIFPRGKIFARFPRGTFDCNTNPYYVFLVAMVICWRFAVFSSCFVETVPFSGNFPRGNFPRGRCNFGVKSRKNNPPIHSKLEETRANWLLPRTNNPPLYSKLGEIRGNGLLTRTNNLPSSSKLGEHKANGINTSEDNLPLQIKLEGITDAHYSLFRGLKPHRSAMINELAPRVVLFLLAG